MDSIKIFKLKLPSSAWYFSTSLNKYSETYLSSDIVSYISCCANDDKRSRIHIESVELIILQDCSVSNKYYEYFAGRKLRDIRQSMMHARSFICKINDSCLLSRRQHHVKSTIASDEHSKTKKENNALQLFVQPTKNIPGPKALPLLGNWFRFIPYIGKRSFLSSQVRKILHHYSLFFSILNQILDLSKVK